MNRYTLSGITVHLPLVGVLTTIAAEGDWRSTGGTFLVVEHHENGAGLTLMIGPLNVILDRGEMPKGSGLVPFVKGCAVRIRTAIFTRFLRHPRN